MTNEKPKSLIPYKKVKRAKVKLPNRAMKGAYDDQATLKGRHFVPERMSPYNLQ